MKKAKVAQLFHENDHIWVFRTTFLINDYPGKRAVDEVIRLWN